MDMHVKLPSGIADFFTQEIIPLTALDIEEQELTLGFDHRRIQDFTRGRYCAHQCLKTYKMESPILKDEDGAPIWPDGVVGSISHTFDVAGAVVAKQEDYRSIGLDIEQIGRVDRNLWPVLFTASEQAYLIAQPFHLREKMSTVMFSLKEAYFKMQYPLSKKGLEFEDISVIIATSGKIKIHSSNLMDLAYTISCDFTILGDLVVSYVLCKQIESA